MLVQDSIRYEGVEPALSSFPQQILLSTDGRGRVGHAARTGDAQLAPDSTQFSHFAMRNPQSNSQSLLIPFPIQS